MRIFAARRSIDIERLNEGSKIVKLQKGTKRKETKMERDNYKEVRKTGGKPQKSAEYAKKVLFQVWGSKKARNA